MLATADKASQLKKEVTGVWSGLAAVASRGVWKLNKVTKENIIKPIVAAVDTKYTSLEKWATDKLNQVKTKVTKVGNDIGKGVEKVGNTITDAHKSAVEGTVKVIVAWADAKNKVVKIYNEWYDEWKDPEKFAQEQKQAKAREVAAKTPAPKKPAQSSSKT
jgi:predicted transcriptional regulator